MASDYITVDSSAGTLAVDVANHLRRLMQVANDSQALKARMDKVIGAGSDWQQLVIQLGLERTQAAATTADAQTVYNLHAGSNLDINGTEAVPDNSRQYINGVGPK